MSFVQLLHTCLSASAFTISDRFTADSKVEALSEQNKWPVAIITRPARGSSISRPFGLRTHVPDFYEAQWTNKVRFPQWPSY